MEQSPKDVERARRDESASDFQSLCSTDFPMENSTLIPYGGQNFWTKCITNRKCKRELVTIPVPFIPVYFTKLSEGEAKICHC